MEINIAALQRERKSLLTQWKDATGAEKMDILVRIMDIDEQLGLENVKRQKNRTAIG